MEAAGKGMLLVALADQAQAAGMFVLFGAHMLDVHLGERTCVSLGQAFQTIPASCSPPSTQLTWQAFRLSLISTWLVWVPTHI